MRLCACLNEMRRILPFTYVVKCQRIVSFVLYIYAEALVEIKAIRSARLSARLLKCHSGITKQRFRVPKKARVVLHGGT